MSIRPIDMQVIIPKTSEVSKISHTENQKPMEEQMQFATQLDKQYIQNQQQVLEGSKSEKSEIKDREGRNKREYSKSKEKKNEQENKKDKKPADSTSIFDVKI